MRKNGEQTTAQGACNKAIYRGEPALKIELPRYFLDTDDRPLDTLYSPGCVLPTVCGSCRMIVLTKIISDYADTSVMPI
jgi:hypothetical protein